MKAVVMAGGLATRLRPMTTATNKHMLRVYDRPMIQRNIETLVASGITEILVLLSNSFAQPVMQLLENGRAYGANILYGYYADGTGVAKHMRVARKFIGDEPFMLYLGDSFYMCTLDPTVSPVPHMWVMPLDETDDFRKYAEVVIEEGSGKVLDIIEKPQIQKSGLVQTGAWIFTPDVFDLAEHLVHTSEKEVQVRTVVAEYVRQGRMHATMLPPGSFLDLGTPEALFRAQQIAREHVLRGTP